MWECRFPSLQCAAFKIIEKRAQSHPINESNFVKNCPDYWKCGGDGKKILWHPSSRFFITHFGVLGECVLRDVHIGAVNRLSGADEEIKCVSISNSVYFVAFVEFIKFEFNRLTSTLSTFLCWNICCQSTQQYQITSKWRWIRSAGRMIHKRLWKWGPNHFTLANAWDRR